MNKTTDRSNLDISQLNATAIHDQTHLIEHTTNTKHIAEEEEELDETTIFPKRNIIEQTMERA